MLKRRTNNECLSDLRKSIAIGTRVLQAYARDKLGYPLHIWLFALYAKMIGSARSILVLLEGRQFTDCPLLMRSLYDTALDIEFILSKPAEAKLLHKLIKIESIIDRFELLEMDRRASGKSTAEYIRSRPEFAERVKYYEWAKKQREFGLRKGWPKQWRYITVHEKREALKATDPFVNYAITSMGNAFAHSRPIAVAQFVRSDARGKCLRFTTNCILPLQDKEKTATYPTLGVLAIGGQLAEQFCLGVSIQRAIAHLGVQIAPKAFQRDYESTLHHNHGGK